MKIFLVRHAESENNAKPAYQRVEDPALTNRGRLQANHLAEYLAQLTHDRLITSPFLRTLQTTRLVLEKRLRPLDIWDDVFERGGCYRGYRPDNYQGAPGLGRSAILRQVQLESAECRIDSSIGEEGWWKSRPRESDEAADDRARRVCDRLILEHGQSPARVVAILHADFIRCLLRQMFGEVFHVDRLGPILNAGITCVRFEDDQWHMDWLNSVSHLPERLVTSAEH